MKMPTIVGIFIFISREISYPVELNTKKSLLTSGQERPPNFGTSKMFVLQINLKLLTTAFYFLLNTAEHKIFSANKYENANYIY